MSILGVDLSHYQGNPNFALVHSAHFDFAILKASEGAGSYDGSFGSSAKNAHGVGMLVGGYHFARPSQSSGSSQAKRFASLCAGEGATLAALDIETTGGLGQTSLRAWCADFLGTLEAEHKGAVAAYCGQSYASALGDVLFASGRGRWIASPGWPPHLAFDLWQSSWKGRVPGIAGDVDVDTWAGDAASLAAWFGVKAAAPTPPVIVKPPAAPVTSAPSTHREETAMLISYQDRILLWNFGGTRASVVILSDPAVAHYLQSTVGLTWCKPTDAAHAAVVKALVPILKAA